MRQIPPVVEVVLEGGNRFGQAEVEVEGGKRRRMKEFFLLLFPFLFLLQLLDAEQKGNYIPKGCCNADPFIHQLYNHRQKYKHETTAFKKDRHRRYITICERVLLCAILLCDISFILYDYLSVYIYVFKYHSIYQLICICVSLPVYLSIHLFLYSVLYIRPH